MNHPLNTPRQVCCAGTNRDRQVQKSYGEIFNRPLINIKSRTRPLTSIVCHAQKQSQRVSERLVNSFAAVRSPAMNSQVLLPDTKANSCEQRTKDSLKSDLQLFRMRISDGENTLKIQLYTHRESRSTYCEHSFV
jgi:hypothetical protein